MNTQCIHRFLITHVGYYLKDNINLSKYNIQLVLSIRYFLFIFVLRLTHLTPGIETGGRIEVCDYSMNSVSATLDTLPR